VQRIIDIMARLRAPDGCPWDREQDAHSLKAYIIEEAYEVCEAIESGDPKKLCDELGDLLLQVVFQAQIANESGAFNINDVVNAISDKMERRHPHVFGDETAESAEQVMEQWEQRKLQEKGRKGYLDGIPKHLPGLLKARRISDKAALVGFEWPTIDGAKDKVDEEWAELQHAAKQDSHEDVVHELGDVLFALVNLSRYLKADPEDALRRTVGRFSKRFRYVENQILARGEQLQDVGLEAMDALWEEAKRLERDAK
jgi:MazG family protein